MAGACERLYLRPSGEAAGCPEPRLGHCWSAHPVSAPGPRAPGSQGPLGVMAERCDLKWPAWTSAPSQASPGRERGERSCQTPGSFTAAPTLTRAGGGRSAGTPTVALASAALAFFSRALQASRSRRRFWRSRLSFCRWGRGDGETLGRGGTGRWGHLVKTGELRPRPGRSPTPGRSVLSLGKPQVCRVPSVGGEPCSRL